MNANRKNETHHTISERNKTFKLQFEQPYQIDYTDPIHYDLITHVDEFSDNSDLADFILSKIRNKEYQWGTPITI